MTTRRGKGGAAVGGLGPVPLTLTVPLWARATETRRPNPILTDWTAVAIAGSLDFDFEALHVPRTTIAGACARTAVIDDMVRAASQADPRLMLVNIGEGLDNRFARVDNGVMSCLDLDLPEVMRIRNEFVQASGRRRMISQNVLDATWMDAVGANFKTVLLVAEGVLMYMQPGEVRALFAEIAARFPGAQIVFDSLSPLLAWSGAGLALGRGLQAQFQWSVKHAHEIEAWGSGYALLERRSVLESHHAHFGMLVRNLTRIFPPLVWTHSINRFRLGKSARL